MFYLLYNNINAKLVFAVRWLEIAQLPHVRMRSVIIGDKDYNRVSN